MKQTQIKQNKCIYSINANMNYIFNIDHNSLLETYTVRMNHKLILNNINNFQIDILYVCRDKVSICSSLFKWPICTVKLY